MKINNSWLLMVIRFARPWSLIAGALLYALGLSMVKYLGMPLQPERLWIGYGMVLMLQLSSTMLKAHFDTLDAGFSFQSRTKPPSDPTNDPLERLPRNTLLIIAITTLTVGALLTVIMVTAGAIKVPSLIILGIMFLLAFFYAVPPLRLVYSGYGELVESTLHASLVPAFAFMLQTGELHRFLFIITLPLITLFLAARIALSLQPYARDLKAGHRTLMIALGWEEAIAFHNLLIPSAYLLIIAGGFLGLPWTLTWPGLLTVPLGILEIRLINQIASGSKPSWRLLSLTARCMVGLTIYLIAFAFLTG